MPTDPGLNFYYVIFKFYNILTAIKYCEITGNTNFLEPRNLTNIRNSKQQK